MTDTCAAAHEAGHVASLILSGRLPRSVAVGPLAAVDSAGSTYPDLGDGLDKDMASDVLLCILVGPLSEPERRGTWPPHWNELGSVHPVRAWQADARKAALLARFLRLDEADWNAYCGIALHLASDPTFKALAATIAAGLCRVPELTADDLKYLIGPERVRRFLEEED